MPLSWNDIKSRALAFSRIVAYRSLRSLDHAAYGKTNFHNEIPVNSLSSCLNDADAINLAENKMRSI
jgi:hypothetical protein